MKAAKQRHSHPARAPRPKSASGPREFSLPEAQHSLARLADLAIHGKAVYIVLGRRRLILQPASQSEPAASSEFGYFSACHTEEEVRAATGFGAASSPFGPDIPG